METLIKWGEALIDTRQIKTIKYDRSMVTLTFGNGDSMDLRWRDAREEAAIRAQLTTVHAPEFQ